MELIDYVVLFIYFGGMAAIGVWAMRRVKGQEDYFKMIQKNDIVFSIGPAGTGKTFLAVAFAISALENNEVDGIGIQSAINSLWKKNLQ